MNDLTTANYKSLSFDCYGTLIDWENGILDFVRPLLESYDVHVIDEWILEFFAEHEPVIQAQGGSYRSVLSKILAALGTRLAFSPDANSLAAFADSMEQWQPFPDSVDALASLRKNFELVALSNIDDDLFAAIRNGTSYNEGEYGAKSTMTAILGRMATYSGKPLEWDKAINSEISIMPKEFSWTALPPTGPNADGEYPIPLPGVTEVV